MCERCEHLDSEIERFRGISERVSAQQHLYGRPAAEGVKRVLHDLEAQRGHSCVRRALGGVHRGCEGNRGLGELKGLEN